MSIALTVVVAPSRRLRALLAGAATCLLAAAAAVGLAAPAFTAGPVVAAALLFAGLCVAHAALRPAMVHRIDISGPGQLRLTVQQGVRPSVGAARTVRLLSGSTRWPRLMLLRLAPVGDVAAQAAADARGARFPWPFGGRGKPAQVSVPVCADSLSPDAFRALAVAVGALGNAGGASSTERKIL